MRIFYFIMLCIITLPSTAKTKVTFIIPDNKGPIFWQLVSDVSQATALSLNIKLEVIYSDSNRFAVKKTIDEVSQRKTKPDYLIFRPFYGNTITAFDQLEAAKIKFITLEQAFTGKTQQLLGQPQEKYKYWLGQINYDNKAGGKLLLDALITAHFNKYPHQAMHIAGIGGDFDKVSKDRQNALENYQTTKLEQTVMINQIFQMNWDPKLIIERFSMLRERYPLTNTYWCAGDQMALTILQQLPSNETAIIGGFDWLPSMLKKIKTGEVTASVGGHFLMVSLALTKIVDYENGVKRFLTPPLLHKYELITQKNIQQHITFFNKRQWYKIDFSRYLFSKNTDNRALTIKHLLDDINNSSSNTAQK